MTSKNGELEKVKKDEKPELKAILEFSKRNEQQLCDILPESTVINRKIANLNKHQKHHKAQTDRYRAAMTAEKSEVEYLELRARKVTAQSIVYSNEQRDNATASQVLGKVFELLNIEKEDNGNSQAINSYLKTKMPEIYKELGIMLPPSPEPEKGND